MQKLSYANLYRGHLVALNDSYTAQVYTIAEVDRKNFTAVLQWREGQHLCSQHYNGPLYPATIEQVEYSIAANGPLVSVNDIVEWA